MNFTDLQEAYARFIGYPISTERQDWQVQQIKDDLNSALTEIVDSTAYLWHHVRESSFALVASTSTYALDDFCIKPISFWTEDAMAHSIEFVDPREQDMSGVKSSNAAYVSTGPFEVTWYPPTTSATTSGASGSGTGITVAEGNTTVTQTGATFLSTHAGKRIRLNGEDMDFTVSSFTNTNTIVLNRAYRARLTGIGQTGVGSGLTNAKWEITPPGTYQVQFRPTPTSAKTIYYRYIKSHSRMLNTDDVPDLPERYHYLILDKAIIRSTKFAENPEAYGLYVHEYQQGIADMIREDQIDKAMHTQLHYASPFPSMNRFRAYPPDVYRRGYR